jgi:hypothetical protein
MSTDLAPPDLRRGAARPSGQSMRFFDLRLAFRLTRFEILGFAVLIALASVAAVVTAAQLDATGWGAHCPRTDMQPPACEAMAIAFNGISDRQGALVQGFLGVLPFLLGALVGAPMVAREIERGTSRLAWSLAPSRVRWLVARVLPVLAVVVGLSLVAGFALDRLVGATRPDVDMANSFVDFGGRGVVLAARAVFVFAVGVAVGAGMGRMLPALIMTAVIATVGISGGSAVHGRWLASEAVWVAAPDFNTGNPGDLIFDERFLLANGRVVSLEDAYANQHTGDSAAVPPPQSQLQALVVRGTDYGFAQAREVAALAGASLVALGIGAFTVRRRRPG